MNMRLRRRDSQGKESTFEDPNRRRGVSPSYHPSTFEDPNRRRGASELIQPPKLNPNPSRDPSPNPGPQPSP